MKRKTIEVPGQMRKSRGIPNHHGNFLALEGSDRCFCGCKYWENDQCVDCGTWVSEVLIRGPYT